MSDTDILNWLESKFLDDDLAMLYGSGVSLREAAKQLMDKQKKKEERARVAVAVHSTWNPIPMASEIN